MRLAAVQALGTVLVSAPDVEQRLGGLRRCSLRRAVPARTGRPPHGRCAATVCPSTLYLVSAERCYHVEPRFWDQCAARMRRSPLSTLTPPGHSAARMCASARASARARIEASQELVRPAFVPKRVRACPGSLAITARCIPGRQSRQGIAVVSVLSRMRLSHVLTLGFIKVPGFETSIPGVRVYVEAVPRKSGLWRITGTNLQRQKRPASRDFRPSRHVVT